MHIRTLVWDRVTIKYPKRHKKDDFVFINAVVAVKDSTVTVATTPSTDSSPSHTYARPKILELTPWGFRVEAYWFSNEKIDDEPTIIVGEFDVDMEYHVGNEKPV